MIVHSQGMPTVPGVRWGRGRRARAGRVAAESYAACARWRRAQDARSAESAGERTASAIRINGCRMLQLLLFVVQASRATPASAAMEENDLASASRMRIAEPSWSAAPVDTTTSTQSDVGQRTCTTQRY